MKNCILLLAFTFLSHVVVSANSDISGSELNIKNRSLGSAEENDLMPQMEVFSFDPLCFNGLDGSIIAEAFGGIPPYSFSLNGGIPTENYEFTDLGPGDYTVTVIDEDGATSTQMVTLDNPKELIISLVSTSDNFCFSEFQGSIEVEGSGGTSTNGYTYSINGSVEQDNGLFEGLPNGFYVVTVFDENQCSKQLSLNIASPSMIQVAVVNVVGVSCPGESNGSAEVIATGGAGDYTYSIDGGDFLDVSAFSDLAGGLHTVEVKDANGCIESVSFTIEVPDSISFTAEVISNPCYGDTLGQISITALGGTAPYTYIIDGIDSDTTSVFQNLIAGIYTIDVSDILGCTMSQEIEVLEPQEVILSADTLIGASCMNEGQVILNLSGAQGDVVYYVDSVMGMTDTFELEVGTYEAYAQDTTGCTAIFDFEIVDLSNIVIEISEQTNISCAGLEDGSVDVIATGGEGSITYSLDGNPGSSASTFNNLGEGNYIIIATDTVGCFGTKLITITEPDELSIDIEENSGVACFSDGNAIVELTVVNGTGPYELFTDQGSVMIDSISYTINGLPAGDVMITVFDSLGCELTDTLTITENPPIQLTIDSIAAVNCAEAIAGYIDITADGGVGDFTYTLDSISSFMNLSAGFYSIFAIDEYNCNTEISIEVNEPQELILEVIHFVGGNGTNGEITVIASGGTEPYMFSIDDKESFQDTSAFTNLPEGDYIITVVDANGCEQIVNQSLVDVVDAQLERLEISPNPASSFLNIQGEFDSGDAVNVEIYNAAGQLVTIVNSNVKSEGIAVDVSGLRSGLYQVRINLSKVLWRGRFFRV